MLSNHLQFEQLLWYLPGRTRQTRNGPMAFFTRFSAHCAQDDEGVLPPRVDQQAIDVARPPAGRCGAP